MKTWCIYIDESGNNPENAQFIYVAICVPFNSQQEFLKSYLKIVNPLVGISGREIKYGDILNKPDMYYQREIEQVCKGLLTHFSHIEDAKIIRVKAIRKKMHHKGNSLRGALFRKTLELSKEFLPVDH